MAHRNQYRITPRARDDLIAIARFTEHRWGKLQRDRYLRALEHRFDWLAQNPGAGRHREDVREGYFCYPQGQHLIFYLVRESGIAIIGIPHQHMDSDRYP